MSARASTPMSTLGALAVPVDARLERAFVTPEGVPLRLSVASAGSRITAFAIDAAIIVGALVAFTVSMGLLGLAGMFGGGGGAVEWVAVVWLVGFFFLRNAYFLSFELGERAATPGKRIARIRVAAGDGGRLTADAVIARNLLREIEVFLPLSFLATGAAGEDGGGILSAWAGLGWAGLFLLFPLLNRDRLRCGDVVAGTWVVRDPRRRLGRALTVEAESQEFGDAELRAYGAFELHTLEDVLRRGDAKAVTIVADAIAAKIGRAAPADARAFLDSYYTGLKGRLERELLMGRRRRDKHDI